MLCEGELGIHPPGALGVGFFIHAGAESLIGRGGDGITQLLKELGSLRLQDGDALREVSLKNRIFANVLEADALNRLPELLLVCCNPSQLPLLTGELTRFVESLVERGRLRSLEDIRRNVPILLVLPNGILSEFTLQTYLDQLTESILMDRLPGVTEEMNQALLDRIVRGISLQAGGRQGSGADTVYRLEKKGMLIFAGGGAAERERVEAIVAAHDYPFTHARDVPGTRIEFDKAMISIVLNVGGLIYTVKPSGELIDLRMGDLCKDSSKAQFIEQVTRAVFDVGRAIDAYPADATYDEVWADHHATILKFAGHVTSSLKTFRDALGAGLNTVSLFSNEEWILTPLAGYAAKAGLTDEEAMFKKLKLQVQQSMARAIRYRDHGSNGQSTRTQTMKLTAQRNISIEAFEAGPDDMVLVGTMLDNEHLIKLEMNVHLPDEQITRSSLSMVRVPFLVCREVEAVADRLVGLRIERGVINEIAHRVGGGVGCSHIKELATNIVYFVASYLVRRRAGVDSMDGEFERKSPEERFGLTRDLLRDSCLAYCQTTPAGLDKQIGIQRIGEEHSHSLPLGEHAPSFGVLLRDRAAKRGDSVYVRYREGEQQHSITWNDFAGQTFQIARHLIELGIRPGDRICMMSENRPEMFMFELACMSIGVVTVPIFAGYPAPQAAYVLDHSRPKFVVASGNHQLQKIQRETLPWIKQYYCMDFDATAEQWGALDFKLLTAEGGASEQDLDDRIKRVQADDLIMVMYTSGTTGPPKGVKLCSRNLISQQQAISQIWNVTEKDVFMSYLPWHHSFGGLFERFMTLYSGCELCLDDSRGRSIDRLIENWLAFTPTLFFSVPRIHEAVLNHCHEHPEVERTILGGRLRFVFTAGAPLPAKIEAVYRRHEIPVLEGWGLTETSPCVTCTTAGSSWQSGYVGAPIPGVKIRIDTNQEILVKGPNVMLGYLDDEEATSHVITEEGWFRTGDLGEITPDGLRILGRKDRTFKLTNGEKVHPLRLENLLCGESPYISQALVLGSGEGFVGALLYLDFNRLSEWVAQRGLPSENCTKTPEVRDLYASEVERINEQIKVKYQRIRRVVFADRDPSMERGELTPSGKIVRKTVIDIYKKKIDVLFEPELSSDVIEVTHESKKQVACES
ncbi:MAG: AMP-binding protein [Planctomycetes bacterium]|nr:AMP-binding protein [Planctomycetota bacterium]